MVATVDMLIYSDLFMKLPQNGAASKQAFNGSEGSQFSRKLRTIDDYTCSLVLLLYSHFLCARPT